MNNNYAALAAAAVASSSNSSTSSNNNNNSSNSNTNTNAPRSQIDQISPPLSTNNNNNSSAIPSNTSSSNNGLSNLPPNLLNQLNVANLANSVSSSNRQSAQVNPFFRSNSTMPTNSQQQQQQLSNLIQQQQQLQQQKKLAGSSNLLNFPNSNMNNSLLSGTIGRPSQLQTNPQTNPSDFPVLHRTSNSPFQQQHLAQLQQQLRANSAMNQFPQGGPNSAPILNSSSLQNFMLQLASSASAQNSNLAQSPASQMMMNNLTGQGNNALPYGLGLNSNLSQQMNALNVAVQKNVQVGGNMWSNFGLGLKSQQAGNDQQHQEFNIQQEDFPALPRPQSVNNKTSEGAGQNLTRTNSSSSNDLTALQRMNEPTNNLQHSSSQNNVNSSSSSMLNTNSSGSSNSNSTLNNTTATNTSTNATKGGTSSTQNPTNTSNNNNASSNNNTTNKSNSVNTNQTSTGSSSGTNAGGSSTSAAAKKGIIISPDGRISNVPPNMLLDQFGMVGLLAYLRAADREKDFFALALGTDLTALGLNLNSNENLYHSFLSPFSDVPCRLQDIDYPVPTEYIMNGQIKEKLAPIDVSRYNEDTLFYLFHMNGGDLMQLQAASVLYDRDWRYHTEKRFWLTKVPGLEPQQKTVTFEKGVYTVFDVNQWRRLQLEMTIEYSKLAEKPHLPGVLSSSGSSQQQQGNNNQSNNSIPSVLNLQQQLQHQQQMQQTFNAGLGSNNVGVPLTTNPTSASSF